MNDKALTFAVLLPALLVAHHFADHWVQTGWQAALKGNRGKVGVRACVDHVLTYTLVTAVVTGLLWGLFDLRITPLGFVAGQLISAVTHYWADRRFTLEWLTRKLGKHGFYRAGRQREVEARTVDGVLVELVWSDGSERDGPIPWDNQSMGTGAYVLDQSWHWVWLGVAAVAMAVTPW